MVMRLELVFKRRMVGYLIANLETGKDSTLSCTRRDQLGLMQK